MTFLITATDVSGNTLTLPEPISLEIAMAVDTPVHAMYLTVPCTFPLNELTDISVAIDGSSVFKGIVDEQITQYSGGCTVKINARSFSALLIDNEAIPANYHTPSLADIFSKHAQPYGIKDFIGDNGVCNCDFTIKKGVSEWEVIDTFCKSVLGTIPTITSDGLLDVREQKSSARYTFSNNNTGAIKFSYAKINRRRYGIISQVTYKLATNSDYIYTCPDDDAIARGILRRRLLNLSSNAPEFNEYKIKSAIQRSKSDSMTITLTVPDVYLGELFATADFDDVLLGSFADLCIREILFSLTPDGATTRVTLCPSNILTVL